MDKHPLRTAFEERDAGGLGNALAEDVVFYTPILLHNVSGRELVKRILLTAATGFGPPQFTGESVDDNGRRILTWDSKMDGYLLQVALFITDGPDGKASELRGYMRPAPVARLFKDYMYPHFKDEIPASYWEPEAKPA